MGNKEQGQSKCLFQLIQKVDDLCLNGNIESRNRLDIASSCFRISSVEPPGRLLSSSHRVGFKEELNLLENLKFEAALRSSSMEKTDAVIERLGLARLTSLPFRYLSAGQQRRVALARLLLTNARLWLMDEPFTNLDRAGQALVAELISEHLAGGGLCIVASHQVVDIDAPTTRVTL